jgi:glycosyltransferase involved in cell wall biosynthesis
MTPTLSIVMPVYNEPWWIGVSVADAVVAVERSSFAEPELIIVDDGSEKPTQVALERLRTPFPLRVIRQENQGRILARLAGVRAARGDLVLLLDARVSVRPDGLQFVLERLSANARESVWNADCEIDLRGNPYARFWNVLTEVAYRDYFANRRTMSYGIEEFDRYPKGTSCFLAPREPLLDAMVSFPSHYADSRNASDDTSIIRVLAEQLPINISPSFICVYRSRDALRPFLRHAFHRGVHFPDGWAHPGGRFFGVILAFYPLSALAVVAGLKRPRVALAAAAAVPVASAAAGASLRRSRADCFALSLLGLPWLCIYSAGMWRGLWLALKAQFARLRKRVGRTPATVPGKATG